MTDSPVDVWCQWYSRLPPEIADDLAAALASMFPASTLAPAPGTKPSEDLCGRIRALARDPSSTAGAALALAALTDAVVGERCDPTRWQDTAALLDVLDASVVEALGEVPEVGEMVEHVRLRSPLWARQWKAQRDGWLQLRATKLATAPVMLWLRKARLAAVDAARRPTPTQ